jgi:hypothetical protein
MRNIYKYTAYLILILFLSSCNCQFNAGRSLQYDIPRNAKEKIKMEINSLKSIKKEVFLILGKNIKGYTIDIVPTSNLEVSIQNLKIKKSNRVMLIDNQFYLLVFDYDYQFGATFEKTVEDGENVIITKRTSYLYDYATTLSFDDKWNFIDKKSLIKNANN